MNIVSPEKKAGAENNVLDISNGGTIRIGSKKTLSGRQIRKIKLFLMFFPFLILSALFAYVPLFGWIYAFQDYSPGLPVLKQTFVGLKNFEIIFSGGSDFANVLINTIAIGSLGIVAQVFVPVVLAILISQIRSRRFSKMIQSVTALPYFISWVLVYSIVFSFFSPDDGVVNHFLLSLHLVSKSTDMLGNADAAWYVQTLLGLWKGTGWGAIIYLAAIAGIDPELYDACDVDGANRWGKIWHVTIPGIFPTVMVLLLLAVSNILSNGFDQFWVFQNSLTSCKLEVFDTYVYRLGMINSQYAFSTAMGIFKSVVSIFLLVISNFISKGVRGEYIV